MDLDYTNMRRNLDDFCEHRGCDGCPLYHLDNCDFMNMYNDSFELSDEVILDAYRIVENLGMVDPILCEISFTPMNHIDFSDLLGEVM